MTIQCSNIWNKEGIIGIREVCTCRVFPFHSCSLNNNVLSSLRVFLKANGWPEVFSVLCSAGIRCLVTGWLGLDVSNQRGGSHLKSPKIKPFVWGQHAVSKCRTTMTPWPSTTSRKNGWLNYTAARAQEVPNCPKLSQIVPNCPKLYTCQKYETAWLKLRFNF
jgi:hypothetical protein